MSVRPAVLGIALLLTAAACDGGPVPAPSASPPTCTDPAGRPDAVPDGYRVVAGVVAVPVDRILETAESGQATPRLFAKWGLLVKTGETVEVSVDSGAALVGWGSPAVPSPSVRITACRQGGNPSPWTAFAGGTWLDQPACVPLTIRAGTQTASARMPVGASCG